jgi:transposase-like protein
VEAIEVVYPKAEIQRCIIHQIRSSSRYVSYKDIKGFTADLKPIYRADTEAAALVALDQLETKWGEKYPIGVKSWKENWSELSTMFQYSSEIRRLIYTTNSIENFNRQLRKVTKTKGAFASSDAAVKILYLTTMKVTEKWTMPLNGWGTILANLSIQFGDRVKL